MARRSWTPCRECGALHTNPRSSSLCPPCGKAISAENKVFAEEEANAFAASPFGRFMSLPEDDRWRIVFDRMLDEGNIK